MEKEETLAKDGQKPTPSVISTNPPMWSTGWKVEVDSSPFQSRSATDKTSDVMVPPKRGRRRLVDAGGSVRQRVQLVCDWPSAGGAGAGRGAGAGA